KEYERAVGMLEEGLITDQQFQKALLEKELARLDVEAAEVDKRILELVAERDREELKQTVVRAPAAGRVFRIYKRAGEAVETHGPVLKLVSIDPLFVVGHVPIGTAGRIEVGSRAALELENMAGTSLECTVSVVDKVADAASGTYRVKLTLPNPDGAIMAGARGALTFTLPEPEPLAQRKG
ncbi:MAG: efflux RND transporter periplasmic adaptor subunit, partial [Planctomycetota bacterium]